MTLADPTVAATVLGWLATFLVHSTLWILGAWLVARLVDSSAWRERLWKGALVGGLVTTLAVTSLSTPSLSWRWQRTAVAVAPVDPTPGRPIVLQGSPTEAAGARAPERTGEVGQGGEPVALDVPSPVQAPSRVHVESALLWLWLLGASIGLAHLALAHLRLGRALRGRRPVARGPLVDALTSLTERAGLRRRPRLATSAALASPVALARGEIVVPERALTRLQPGELETLLAHELAHLARRDPWWLLGLNVLRRALWLQPFLGLVTARSMEAAELRCDELAARWTRRELALARCLAEVATWVEGRPAASLVAGMAERPSALVERVERLLRPRRGSRLQGALVGAWIAAMLGALGCEGPQVSPQPDAVRTGEAAPDEEPDQVEALGQLGSVEVTQGTGGKEEMVAFLEAQIAARRAEQEGLKPPHSRWKKLEREIQMLEAQRDQILLGMRVDAGEHGQVDTRAGSKLHVTTITQGGMSMSTAAPHALRLHADGSIDCVNTQLVPPGGKDDTALAEHLEEIALGMDRAPLDPANPDGFRVPDGRLRLLIDVDAPHSLLQRTLQACTLLQVQISKFSLVLVVDGEPGESLRLQLPRDLAQIPEAVEEQEAPAPARPGFEVRLRPVSEGEPGELRLETRLDDQGQLEVQPHLGRVVHYDFQWIAGGPLIAWQGTGERASGALGTARDLEQLRGQLAKAYAADPQLRVTIDALPGSLYADVAALLDVVLATGFTDIVFVGYREQH